MVLTLGCVSSKNARNALISGGTLGRWQAIVVILVSMALVPTASCVWKRIIVLRKCTRLSLELLSKASDIICQVLKRLSSFFLYELKVLWIKKIMYHMRSDYIVKIRSTTSLALYFRFLRSVVMFPTQHWYFFFSTRSIVHEADTQTTSKGHKCISWYSYVCVFFFYSLLLVVETPDTPLCLSKVQMRL